MDAPARATTMPTNLAAPWNQNSDLQVHPDADLHVTTRLERLGSGSSTATATENAPEGEVYENPLSGKPSISFAQQPSSGSLHERIWRQASIKKIRPLFQGQLSEWPPRIVDPFASTSSDASTSPPKTPPKTSSKVLNVDSHRKLRKKRRSNASFATATSDDSFQKPPPALTHQPPKEPEAPFSTDSTPSPPQLLLASEVMLQNEIGASVRFGDLFAHQKTIVCFIRHFYCPLCQDYMSSIVARADPEILQEQGVNLVIISNGSWSMIKSYRAIFKCPFQLYTDPKRKLYRAMGMSLRTTDGGPNDEAGDYVVHGPVSGIGMVLKHAVKMPIANAGDIKQLGGEFILGPGPRCDFAHRMHTTRSHSSVRELLAFAGVRTSPVPFDAESFLADEAEWMEERDRQMQELRKAKFLRRGFIWDDSCSTLQSSVPSLCDWPEEVEQDMESD